MDLTDEDVARLLRILQEKNFEEIEIEWKGMTLRLRKFSSSAPLSSSIQAENASGSVATASADATAAATAALASAEKPRDPSSLSSNADIPGTVTIAAPIMGTFYRRPEPGTRPFVELGDTVALDQTICLIEVMKMFTAVKAETAGIVAAIEAEDGGLVDYGQALFRIRVHG